MSENHEIDVTLGFGGEVVGKAVVNEDGTAEASLTNEGAKKVFPNWDPTEGLSIIEYDPVNYEEYFTQNPGAPRSYEEAYYQQNPGAPRSYEEAYFRNRPKGTFDT